MLSRGRFFLPLIVAVAVCTFADPPPDLPGEEITESERALKKSESLISSSKPSTKKKKKYNWHAPPIDEQLARDKTLIGMGYGALFVPTYSESRLEPEVLVFKSRSKLVASGLPGQRILLEKGRYTIRVGSGSINRMIKYSAEIEEGHTTIIKPDWAGLKVEIINPDYEYIREEYEIYRLGTSIPYGKGYGLE